MNLQELACVTELKRLLGNIPNGKDFLGEEMLLVLLQSILKEVSLPDTIRKIWIEVVFKI